jgi:hypothetical protein
MKLSPEYLNQDLVRKVMERFLTSRADVRGTQHDSPYFHYYESATEEYLLESGCDENFVSALGAAGLIELNATAWYCAGRVPVMFDLTERGLQYLVDLHGHGPELAAKQAFEDLPF